MQDVIEKLSGMEEDDMEEMDEALIQQIQLFNVTLKQEDGEPVTESEISFLGESNKYATLALLKILKLRPHTALY